MKIARLISDNIKRKLVKEKEISIKGIILALYIFLAISVKGIAQWDGYRMELFILEHVIGLVILMIICPWVLKRTGALKVNIREVTVSKGQKVVWIVSFFIFSFNTLYRWYLAYYPGAFSSDTLYQYKQALTGEYNDWKPILQTLITFTFPVKLTGKIEAIVLFQIIEYAFVLTYMSYIILKYSNKWFAIMTLLYILSNPVTGNIVVFPWKDVTFAMCAVLLVIFGVQIYYTDGRWIEKRRCLLGFTFCLIVSTIIRHNAVLFTIPFMIAVMLHINKKRRFQILILFMIGFILIKGPLYMTLSVYENWNHKTRLLGLPMSVLGNVAKESPDSLDESTKKFMYALASDDMWRDVYRCGNFNSMKWNIDQSLIEDAGLCKVTSMSMKALANAPVSAIRGLICLTDIVYAIEGDLDWEITPYTDENEYGVGFLDNDGREKLKKYTDFTRKSILKYFFWYIGVVNLIIITSLICKCRFSMRADWQKSLFVLPLLCYNFGTMLLLSGNDFRYFYLNFPICPMMLLILYGERSASQGERKYQSIQTVFSPGFGREFLMKGD